MIQKNVNGNIVEQDLPIDYVLGKDIHFTVITHSKEILLKAKTI